MSARFSYAFALWVCALTVAAGPVPAQADAPTLAIRSQSIRAEIAGRLATTTIEHVYVNYTDRQQEAVFAFRAPSDAAVHELAMWVSGLRSPAELHPRVAAEQIYREIVNTRRDPALLVSMGDGLWNLQVFPVPPRGTQKIQIVCTHLLRVRDGRVAYEAPRFAGGTFLRVQEMDFSAVIRAPGGVRDLKTHKKALGVQRRSDGAVAVGFRAEQFPLRDHVGFSFIAGSEPAGVVSFAPPGQDRIFATVLPPPEALAGGGARRRNIAIVLDASASMTRGKFELARYAAMQVLGRLRPADRLAVVVVGPDARLWKDGLVPANKANIAAAKKYLTAVKPAGGTDLAGGLRAAESFNTDSDEPLCIFLITDGFDQVGARPGRSPRPERKEPAGAGPAPNCRVFALGIAGDDGALAGLADRTGGIFWGAADGEEAAEGVAELMAEARRANVADVRMEVRDERGILAGPIVHSELVPARELVIAGRCRAAGKVRLTLSAKIDGKKMQQSYDLDIPEPAGAGAWAGPGLRKVWAHLRADQIWRGLQRGEAGFEDLEALVGFSKAERVGTRATAFLVLESDADYVRRGIERNTSFLRADESLARAEREWRSRQRAKPTAAQAERARRLRAQARELLRLGHYLGAANAFERLAKLDTSDLRLATRAAALREFVALRASIAEAKAREEYRRVSATGPWAEMLLPPTVVEFVPTEGLKDIRIQMPDPLSPADRPTMRKLQRRYPKFEAKETPFADFIKYFREMAGVNVHVKWGMLEMLGIEKNTRVSVSLRDVTAEKVLNVVLDDVGGLNPVSFTVDEGVLLISTREDLARRTVVRVYDIRDVLVRIPNFAGPRLGLFNVPVRQSYVANVVFGNTSGGGGLFASAPERAGRTGGLFGAPGRAGRWTERPSVALPGTPTKTPAVRAREVADLAFTVPNFAGPRIDLWSLSDRPWAGNLVDLIRWTVAPDTWIGNSGEFASMRLLGGMLVVTQTPENHRAIVKLLTELRDRLGGRGGQAPTLWPEALFTADARPAKWVIELLGEAREGKLSKFSSVRIRKVGRRVFARIGGIWFDTALSASSKVRLIARGSPAAAAVVTAEPSLKGCFALGRCVIVAVGAETAVCLDERGIAEAGDPALKTIIEALSKRP